MERRDEGCELGRATKLVVELKVMLGIVLVKVGEGQDSEDLEPDRCIEDGPIVVGDEDGEYIMEGYGDVVAARTNGWLEDRSQALHDKRGERDRSKGTEPRATKMQMQGSRLLYEGN